MNAITLSARILLIILLAHVSLNAAVFTSDTTLNANDATYDGQSIVISNCTVTIDGAHAFSSLRVASGATLTHSPSTNGLINIMGSATDEPQILTSTNATTLA